MGISEKLDEFVAMIENARAMPMSASCIVNRNEMLEAVEELRKALPEELRKARGVLRDRVTVVEEGQGRGAGDHRRGGGRALPGSSRVPRSSRRRPARPSGCSPPPTPSPTGCAARSTTTSTASWPTSRSCCNRTLHAVEHGRNKINGRHELEALQDIDDGARSRTAPGLIPASFAAQL